LRQLKISAENGHKEHIGKNHEVQIVRIHKENVDRYNIDQYKKKVAKGREEYVDRDRENGHKNASAQM
jgi:hypothetical protein